MARAKHRPFLFFFLAIVAVSVFAFAVQWFRGLTPRLEVPGNAGIGSLLTVDDSLAAVYQDGRTCVWDWDAPTIKQADFTVGSGRAIALQGDLLAAVARMGERYVLSVYEVWTGRRLSDLTVGWGEQDVHLRNCHARTRPTVIRWGPERDGQVVYEFALADLDAEVLRPAVVRPAAAERQTLRDFAVSEAGVLYAAGADGGQARLMAVNLDTGRTLWEQVWADTEELTTITVSIDDRTVWAGDRAGSLLKIAAEDGRQLEKVWLLRPGERRPTTNDYSVLNLTASPDGRFLGCTIAPVAYVVDADSGKVVQQFGGHKVVSKVVFSPDSRRLATADLRADGVILIHTLKQTTGYRNEPMEQER